MKCYAILISFLCFFINACNEDINMSKLNETLCQQECESINQPLYKYVYNAWAVPQRTCICMNYTAGIPRFETKNNIDWVKQSQSEIDSFKNVKDTAEMQSE